MREREVDNRSNRSSRSLDETEELNHGPAGPQKC